MPVRTPDLSMETNAVIEVKLLFEINTLAFHASTTTGAKGGWIPGLKERKSQLNVIAIAMYRPLDRLGTVFARADVIATCMDLLGAR